MRASRPTVCLNSNRKLREEEALWGGKEHQVGGTGGEEEEEEEGELGKKQSEWTKRSD